MYIPITNQQKTEIMWPQYIRVFAWCHSELCLCYINEYHPILLFLSSNLIHHTWNYLMLDTGFEASYFTLHQNCFPHVVFVSQGLSIVITARRYECMDNYFHLPYSILICLHWLKVFVASNLQIFIIPC